VQAFPDTRTHLITSSPSHALSPSSCLLSIFLPQRKMSPGDGGSWRRTQRTQFQRPCQPGNSLGQRRGGARVGSTFQHVVCHCSVRPTQCGFPKACLGRIIYQLSSNSRRSQSVAFWPVVSTRSLELLTPPVGTTHRGASQSNTRGNGLTNTASSPHVSACVRVSLLESVCVSQVQ